jgi:thiamine-monophosphate kinase
MADRADGPAAGTFPSIEYGLIDRIRRILPAADKAPYEIGIGDDAAVRVCAAGERLVVTADVSVENIHFSLDAMTFSEIGYKAMAANLSDCAAMGASPDGAVAQIVFPVRHKYGPHEDAADSIAQIYEGFARACGRWGFTVVGGDISGGGVWTIGITLIGSVPPSGRAVTRAGIKDGDALWVTGTPGASAAGLAALREWGREEALERCGRLAAAHIAPVPRIDEGRAFAACGAVRAMMDLSDGLSKDVGTLCYENKLGFIFDGGAERGPSPVLSDMAALAAETGADRREWFYHGGEEYELLVACDPSFDLSGLSLGVSVSRLGSFTSKIEGMIIERGDGTSENLPLRGWDHLAENT